MNLCGHHQGMNQTGVAHCQVRGVRLLMGDEGSFLPNGNLLCLLNAKTIETVHKGQKQNLFDN